MAKEELTYQLIEGPTKVGGYWVAEFMGGGKRISRFLSDDQAVKFQSTWQRGQSNFTQDDVDK